MFTPSALRKEIEAIKARLARHPLYTEVDSLEGLQVFMERHVGCVLDFMSILKSLQRDLTCVQLPWHRPSDPESARLINEIVVGEESDEVTPGVHKSHYQWYLEAMEEVGADISAVLRLEEGFVAGLEPQRAIARAGLPPESGQFVRRTFELLERGLHVRAAVFFHGREDVIPQMFLPLAEALEAEGHPCGTLVAYLRRHIEVDGGEHGPAAEKLLERLFAGDPHREMEALEASRASLLAREELWNRTRIALAGARATQTA